MLCSLLQFLKDAWDGFSLAIIVFIVSIVLNTCVIVNAYIPSESMSYTINLGDRIIGNRLSYRDDHQPERYDIIIFHAPDRPGVLYIKRVIGLPGDRIDLKDGHIYINGDLSDESFCSRSSETKPGTMEYPFTVPDNSYFVLGDNRANSEDSRFWNNHYVQRNEIVAKAVFRYWPAARFGKIE